MASIAVTPVALAMNTPSADLAAGTSIVSAAANQWVVSAAGSGVQVNDLQGTRLLLRFIGVATSTVTIHAGDRPPSQRADLGDLTVSLANGQHKFVAIEAARFINANGQIVVSVNTGDTTAMTAFLLPRGLGGNKA